MAIAALRRIGARKCGRLGLLSQQPDRTKTDRGNSNEREHDPSHALTPPYRPDVRDPSGPVMKGVPATMYVIAFPDAIAAGENMDDEGGVR
jgi:hypothetical protein